MQYIMYRVSCIVYHVLTVSREMERWIPCLEYLCILSPCVTYRLMWSMRAWSMGAWDGSKATPTGWRRSIRSCIFLFSFFFFFLFSPSSIILIFFLFLFSLLVSFWWENGKAQKLDSRPSTVVEWRWRWMGAGGFERQLKWWAGRRDNT